LNQKIRLTFNFVPTAFLLTLGVTFLNSSCNTTVMIKKIGLLFILFFSVQQLYGQNEIYELPIYYGQYFNDPQINSLIFKDHEDIKLVLGHRRNSNNFGGINTSVFSFQYRLKGKKDNHHHSIGLQITSDKEGFIINRNRAYLNYGFHLKISDQFKFAAGLTAGFYNFSVSANTVTGGFSDFAFDGGTSVSLYSENTEITLGMNQLTSARVQPIDQTIILGRHLNLLLKQSLSLGDNVDIIPSVLSRYSKKSNSIFSGFVSTFGLHFRLKDLFTSGLSIEPKNGFYFFAGVENIKIKNAFLDVNLSYFTPTYKSQKTNIQLFEVFLGYDINLKKSSR
jgi:hypothetical protein